MLLLTPNLSSAEETWLYYIAPGETILDILLN